MTRAIRARRGVIIPIACAMLASIMVLIWQFVIEDEPASAPIGRVSPSFAGYESIESITDAADAVIIGVVTGIVGREVQKLDNPAPEIIPDSHLEHPYVFYEVKVNEVLKGSTGDTITLIRSDHTRVLNEHDMPFEEGQQILLFLASLTGHPGLEEFGDVENLYDTLSFDHGVFEVFGETAIPRTPYFTGETDEQGNRKMEFTLDEIREKIANQGE